MTNLRIATIAGFLAFWTLPAGASLSVPPGTGTSSLPYLQEKRVSEGKPKSLTTTNGRTVADNKAYTGSPGGWTVTTIDQSTGNQHIETWSLRRLVAIDDLAPDGNLVARTTYTYDALGRKTSETLTPGGAAPGAPAGGYEGTPQTPQPIGGGTATASSGGISATGLAGSGIAAGASGGSSSSGGATPAESANLSPDGSTLASPPLGGTGVEPLSATVAGNTGGAAASGSGNLNGESGGTSSPGGAAGAAPQVTSYTYDAAGRIATVQRSGDSKPTTYTYIPGSNRPATITYGNEGTLELTYDASARLQSRKYTPAAATNTTPLGVEPYEITYDYYPNGQQKTMTTTRNGRPVVTAWDYWPGTGQLKTKTIAGQVVERYTYNPDGTVATATDALGRTSVYTTDPATGDLLSETNTTTGVTRSNFDRLGRPGQVSIPPGTAGVPAGLTTDYEYDSDGNITNEHLTAYGLFPAQDLARTFDPATGWLTETQLTGGSISASTATAYTYDIATGNLTGVAGTAGVSTGISATYTYDSAGRCTSTTRAAGSGPDLKRTQTWDPATNHRTQITETANGATVAQYALEYQPDTDKLEKVTLADGSYWRYTYDTKGHLESAVKHAASGTPVAGGEFNYAWDEIGNPLVAGNVHNLSGQPADSLTANDFNQPVKRDWSCIVAVNGTAPVAAKINTEFAGSTFEGMVDPAGRFTIEFPVNPGQWPADNLCHTSLRAAWPAGGDTVTSELPVTITLPEPTTTAAHDLAGFPSSNGAVTYEWTTSGQLSAVTQTPTSRVEYTYDHQPRLITRKTYSRADSAAPWSLTSEASFAYDGWRPVREKRHILTPSARDLTLDYIWGADLSGSVDGAAGVGGLLAVAVADSATGTKTYLPISDWNGNVVKYLDAADLSVAAEFEYSPFNGILSATGPAADILNLRGTTKYYDLLTGLSCSGLRWYDPATGKFLSPDPIGEQGGTNIYLACGGDMINKFDAIGAAEQVSALYGPYDYLWPETTGEAFWVPFYNGMAGFNNSVETFVATPGREALGWASRKMAEWDDKTQFNNTVQTINVSTPPIPWVKQATMAGAYGTQVAFKGARLASGFLQESRGAIVLLDDIAPCTRCLRECPTPIPGCGGLAANRGVVAQINPVGPWKARPPGIRITREGDWWIKEVNSESNDFMRWWGRKSIEAQSTALDKLGDMAASHYMDTGRLFVQDVGETLPDGFRLMNSISRKAYWEGSKRIGWFNDIQPRNMGVNGLIFDPAHDPISKALFYGSTGASVGGGAAYLYFETR